MPDDDSPRCPICGTRERKMPGKSGYFAEHWYCPDEDLHSADQIDDQAFRAWVD